MPPCLRWAASLLAPRARRNARGVKAEKGDEALRRFRVSIAQCDYFVTANLAGQPAPTLSAAAKDAVRTEIGTIESAGYWTVRGAVIMPDHLHLLITLGTPLHLSRIIARLKSRTRSSLLAEGIRWQDNYYEHRLRGNEDAGEVLRYIFLNPYRAQLLPVTETYPWFWLGAADSEWFEPTADNGRPFVEWLR